MLNPLLLEGWTVTKADVTPGLTVIHAEYNSIPEACLKCGTVGKLEKKARAVQMFLDTPAWGGKVEIHVRRIRFQCPHCNGTFMQPLPDMMPGFEMTRRCAFYIAEQGIQTQHAAIARRVGLDEKTVRKLVNAYGQEALKARGITAPVILGIDELTLLDERRSIFTNVGEREVLDLVRDMSKETIRRWLWALPNKARVQIVTIDMWPAYRAAAYEALPRASVVVDKWHIQKKATEALDRVRNRLARAAKSKKARQEALRGRRLLMARQKRLSPRAWLILDGWLKNTPILQAAYVAKEGFFDIWEARSREEAEERYEAWRLAFNPLVVPEFLATVKTVEEWREEIFRYFDAPFTNAYTEAANGLIKAANRAGRGYAFENIRARALLREVIYPLDLFVCECCLGQFHKEEHLLHASTLPREMHVCINCRNRPTIREWYAAYPVPTG